MGSKLKRLGLVSLLATPLVAVGSWLALRDSPQVQNPSVPAVVAAPLPANNLYVERRKAEEQEEFRRWIDEARGGVKYDHTPTLADMIEHLGYVHKSSNVSSLDEAQLICLGEIHRLCGNEEAFILGDKFVEKKDKILVEGSPSLFRDFPAEEIVRAQAKEAYDKVKVDSSLNRPLRGNLDEKDLLELVEGVYGTLDSLQKFTEGFTAYWELNDRHLDALFRKDGQEDSFFSSLARDNKGIVIGADADHRTKTAHLYTSVERALLLSYFMAIRDGKEPHQFLEWLAYEATGVVKPTDSVTDRLNKVTDYVSKLPTSQEHMRRRDLQIAENTVREVKSAQPGQRVWYIFGDDHLGETLFSEVEKNGIRYVAFSPVEEKVAEDTKKERAALGNPLEDHGKEYVLGNILPWYIRERVADGARPYAGNFEGLLK